MNKRFPCPYCKGQGSWVEPVLDYGQGPRYDCGVCEGQGMIEINSPRHQLIRSFSEQTKPKDKV
jgi:hypothetical protein